MSHIRDPGTRAEWGKRVGFDQFLQDGRDRSKCQEQVHHLTELGMNLYFDVLRVFKNVLRGRNREILHSLFSLHMATSAKVGQAKPGSWNGMGTPTQEDWCPHT